MNILFYQHQYPAFGGIERVTTLLARQFVADGHRVSIVSFRHQEGTSLLKDLPPIVKWVQLPDDEMDSRANRVALRQVLDEFNPDHIMFQDSYVDIEFMLFDVYEDWKEMRETRTEGCHPVLPRSFALPQRPDRDETVIRKMKEGFRLAFWPLVRRLRDRRERARRRYICSRVDDYIILSDRYMPRVRTLVGKRFLHKVLSIPNPVDLSRISDENTDRRKEVLFVGTLNAKVKGCDRILSVWEKIEKDFPDWKFRIVGDGVERTRLELLVKSLRLEHVIFEGFKSDPRPFFQRASIFVMASDYEGWPMVLGEAGVNECPPIVTDSFGAVHEMLKNGETGLIVHHFNESQFVCTLKRLMSDEGLRRRIGRAAQKDMAVRFAPSAIARRWYTLLSKRKSSIVCVEHNMPT